MTRIRIRTVFTVIAALAGVVGAFIAGLFVYVSATTRPIHADPTATASVMRGTSPARWADAVARGQRIVRVALTEQNLPGASVAVGTGGEIGTKTDFIGGTAYLMTLPERDVVVTVTSNTSFADMKSVALKVAEAFAQPQKSVSPQ